MISISNNTAKQTLKQYLLQYRSVFKKRSFDIFYWLVLAILCSEEVRSVKLLYDTVIKKYTDKVLNSLYYFLSYTHIPIEKLMIITLRIVLSFIPEDLKSTTIFLTVDDTLQPKYGKHFDCYFKLFDHTNRTGSAYLHGHCFVSLVVNIPFSWEDSVRYISLPIGYRLFTKEKSKLAITSEFIHAVMPELTDYQVILLCDSWYTKGEVLDTSASYENLDIVGAVRYDTVLYDLPPAPTGKRGRPRIKGERLDVKNFSYEKAGNYFIATRKVMTNLFKKPVYVTVTTKDIEQFTSIRLFICTIDPQDIHIFKEHVVEDMKYDASNPQQLPLCSYSIRWNIEVIFYQHKTFWAFGSYMSRNKEAIERYVNLLSIAYTFVSVLPFMDQRFKQYQFQSPQLIKRAFGEQISK